MRYMTFDGEEHESYPIAFLVPRLDQEEIKRRYIDPIGLNESMVISFALEYTKKKTPVKDQKEFLADLVPVLKDLGVEYVVVCDAEYFKTFAKVSKAEPHLGYVIPAESDICKENEFQPMTLYCPNFGAIFYDPPKVLAKIDQALEALSNHATNQYEPPGTDIIHFAAYPKTAEEIKVWLQRLLDMDVDLACDIEGFSLKHVDAGIGTISFAWNEHEGIAFPIDYYALPEKNLDGNFGEFVYDPIIRDMLKDFFLKVKNKLIFHNISYDAMVLIYQLFMEDILDTEGLLYGMEVMLKHWDDTKLITYLATNSCAGNKLGLKDQAQAYAGNYAVEEIKDIRRIPLDQLLQYNLIDALSTWYVYNKHYQTMVDDQQLEIYETLFKPAILDVIQMQLTGFPVNMNQVKKAKIVLEKDEADALSRMMTLPVVISFIQKRNEDWVKNYNETRKVKRVTLADANETFNPNSDLQLRELVYDRLGLPEIDFTDTKLPSTGGDTLKKLQNHTTDPDTIQLLQALCDYKDVAIILSNFIPAFERAVEGPDGWHYLFGNFNLGGTVSGRLSSNNPNLQNIPATGTKYAKVIKECIQAPPGWLLMGLDFNSLEDMISALTTKDPNKLKVYTDGYDGHSLRAFFYYREALPDIEDTVESINSIKTLHEDLRQESKSPTFALTYQGTFITLMNNCGFTEAKAKLIESRYHEMYVVSDQWIHNKLQTASKTGYVEAAFGLKVRTPLLKQVILGTRKTPFEAQAEGRTAGNALGQSWCLLNSRAGVEFNGKVRASPYRLTIRPCAQIHDAQYHIVKDDMDTVMFYNEHVVKAAKWQDHPAIYHDEVKLGGETFICFPNWAHEFSIKNEATEEQINESVSKHVTKLQEKGIL